jgi:hypothetical protein
MLLAILLITVLAPIAANAQGRGNGHGHNNGKGNGHGRHKHDGKHTQTTTYYYEGDRYILNDRARPGHHHHGNHEYTRVVYRSYPRYVHQHGHDCDHHVMVRHHQRPRYIYYTDYDVYFDSQRNVYISYSGRNWTVSASLPVRLHRVDLRATSSMEVHYYEDDFITYLDRGRPMYGRVLVSR